MKVKAVLSLFYLAAVAFASNKKAIDTSNSEIKLLTPQGHEVPEELLSYFNYSFDGEIEEFEGRISAIKRKCVHKYQTYCVDRNGEVNKDRYSSMKEEFNMEGYSQEEFCQIINETCRMISFKGNPLTGENNNNPTNMLDDGEEQQQTTEEPETNETKFLTPQGHEVPKELLQYFDYTFNGEIEEYEGCISAIKRKCNHKYQTYCVDKNGEVNKDRYSSMKEEFNMGDYTQEEFCQIIDETCNMISFKVNPLTGEKNSNPTEMLDEGEEPQQTTDEPENKESKLSTPEGHEVPQELLSYFDYSFDGEIEEYEGRISAIKRKCNHKYQTYCVDRNGEVNKDRYSSMKEEFNMEDYTQEEFCQIIDETCRMISFKVNPLTDEKNNNPTEMLDEEPQQTTDEPENKESKLSTPEGHEVPQELLEYFDYTFNGEPEEYEGRISAIKRKCNHKYQTYCVDRNGEVNKDRYSKMKEEFNIVDYTQEDFCEIISETCRIISFKVNPLTGEKNPNSTDMLDDREEPQRTTEEPETNETKFLTPQGHEVPLELLSYFDYSFDGEIEEYEGHISAIKRKCNHKYQTYCVDRNGQVNMDRYSRMKEEFDMGDYSQEEFCQIIDETCSMISFKVNPLTGEKNNNPTDMLDDGEQPNETIEEDKDNKEEEIQESIIEDEDSEDEIENISSNDGKCGEGIGSCKNGLCCSQYGYCGNTKDYCGMGCQPSYGLCQ